MPSSDIIYQGNARVYLQGKGALQPWDTSNPQFFTYYVGTEESSIVVRDYRQEAIHAAKLTLQNQIQGEFADVFNQPAMIEIFENPDNVEIIMRPGTENEESPVLWIGVIYDGKMPVHKIAWERLKPIQDNATAFAALVQD